MRSLLLLPVLVVASVSFSAVSTGCAAPTEEVESVEAEVRTAQCAPEISAHVSGLSLRTFFGELREPAEYNAMKSISYDLMARRYVEFTGSLTAKKSGRCTYTSANGTTAVLYTKGGKDILRFSEQVRGHEVFVYTYPKTFAPEVTYAAGSTARFVTALAAAPADAFEDVDASEAPSPFWVSLGTGKAEGGAYAGLTIANGADLQDEERPDTVRVSIPAANASATVADSSLAYCTITKNDALSNASRTVFDLALEYELDDGWNGCTFAFTATGYASKLTAGFNIWD